MSNKSKLTVFALALFAIFSIILAGCLLGDDIDTIRSKALEDKVPTNVTAMAVSSSSIRVSWSSVSGASAYSIYRSTSAYGTYSNVGDSYSTSYSDTGLTASTTYYYKVAAYDNSYGTGAQSSYASATTLSSGGSGSGTETNPISLTSSGVWSDGSITSTAYGSAVWYSFNTYSGTTYHIWWNDSYEGNGTKTLDVKVSAYYSSGTSIFTGVDSGWSSPRSFTAGSSGTVKVKVEPYSSGNTGTFAVRYD